MFGKAFSWIRRVFELAGAIQTLGSFGGATLLAIITPAFLGTVLGLPTALLILLGIGVFFVALAIILAILKAFLERGSKNKHTQQGSVVAQDPAPSSDWQLWQELNRLKAENDKLRVGLQESVQEREDLKDWIDKITPFMKRIQFRHYLKAIHRMGSNLHAAQQPDAAAMEEWVSLTAAFIRHGLDDETANFFLVHDGDYSFAGRLRRLEKVCDKPVDMGAKLQPNFDATGALESYPLEWTHRY